MYCNPLADVSLICDIDDETDPASATPLSTRVQPWIDDPGQPQASYVGTGDYTDSEYAWLARAQAQLESATNYLVRHTHGLPTGSCTVTLRNLSCRCGGSLPCSCGSHCLLAPTLPEPITAVTLEHWGADGVLPTETLVMGTDFYIHRDPPRRSMFCRYQGQGPWPLNRPTVPADTEGYQRWTITYGTEPDLWIKEAVADLASLHLNRCLPADRCNEFIVPDHATRAGDITLLTVIDFMREGLHPITSVSHVINHFTAERYGYNFGDPAEPDDRYQTIG